MNKEEKIKLKIEKLRAQSDFHKFEYGQYNIYLIGILTVLIAIFIPIMVYIKDVIMLTFLAVMLIIFSYVAYRFIKSWSDKSLKKIGFLSKEIERLYGELLN